MQSWYEKLVWEVGMKSWYEKKNLYEIKIYSTSPDDNNWKLEGAMNYEKTLIVLVWWEVGEWRDWTLLLCFQTNTRSVQAQPIQIR